MEDLRIAMAVMGLLSMAIFFATARIVRNWRPMFLDAFAVLIVLLIGLYVRDVWGQIWIVKWIPLSSVIVLANWFPLLLAVLAAAFWVRTRALTPFRRIPIQGLLMAGAIGSEIYVIPATPPVCSDSWIEKSPEFPFRICRQTTFDTCSAAAAATVLTAIGKPVTEQEMAVLCLTRQGTTWLGLYHGLAAKLSGSDWYPEFVECEPGELSQRMENSYILLCCQLTDEMNRLYPQYHENDGWLPGVQHTVVLFRVEGNQFLIGDPSQSDPEVWPLEDLERLWTGRGIRVTRR